MKHAHLQTSKVTHLQPAFTHLEKNIGCGKWNWNTSKTITEIPAEQTWLVYFSAFGLRGNVRWHPAKDHCVPEHFFKDVTEYYIWWQSNSWPTCHTFKSDQKRCLVRLLIVPSRALSNAFLIKVQQFAAVARKQCSICCDIVWVWVETEKILLSTKSVHSECNNWIHIDFMDLITFIPTETDRQR